MGRRAARDGGSGGAAACRAFTCVCRLASSESLAAASLSMRSAKSRRAFSTLLASLVSNWYSSFDPNAPADAPCRKNVVVRAFVFF